jgi:hypothetical protein
MVEVLWQDDIDLLLSEWWNLNNWWETEEKAEKKIKKTISRTKKSIDIINFSRQILVDKSKSRNYRVINHSGINFPFWFIYNWEKVKLRWYKLCWIPFYIPEDVYKFILSKSKDILKWQNWNYFTRRTLDEIENYIYITYWLKIE